MKTPTILGEFQIIERFFAPLAATAPGALGLRDDAAIVSVAPGCSVVVSTDTLIEGVHFLLQDSAADIAARGLAVAFSDIAAMGAEPLAYMLSLSLPQVWASEQRERWLESFSGELRGEQQAIGVALIGGDTVATPGPLSLTLTVFGAVATGCELRRSGARPGDVVYVSGSVGDAALGLLVLKGDLQELDDAQRQMLAVRFRRPRPRLDLGLRLRGVAHAAADVSDGLVADLDHICEASDVCATIEMGRIPISQAALAAVRAEPARRARIFSGGDDYELVFTAPLAAADDIARIGAELGLALTAIGRIAARNSQASEPRLRVLGEDGNEVSLSDGGYSHF